MLIVLRQHLDPTRGGVQRTSWHLGHALAGCGIDVGWMSYERDGHREPTVGPLFRGQDNGGIDSAANARVLERAVAKFRPHVVINQAGFNHEVHDVLWAMREAVACRIIGCYRNNPRWYYDNIVHVTRQQLRGVPVPLALLEAPLVWRALRWKHMRKNRPLFAAAVNHADRFMLLAPSFVEELRWYVPDLSEQKVLIAPNAFDMPANRNGEHGKKILFVGRLEDTQKQVRLLAPLWQRLSTHLPEWDFVIAGEGPDGEWLREEFRRMGLKRYEFLGRVKPDELYSQASLLLVTSRYEGFGNILVEAQMHGCVPILFDSYSAARWIVNDGRDAVVVAPFDVGAMCDETARLAEDSDAWRRMSDAARRNAERFSTAAVLPTWLEAIHALREEVSC